MLRPIPIFEAKNKLPLFIHQAESDGPVFIARRNQNVAVLVSFAEYNSLVASAHKKKPAILERAEAFRKRTAGMFTNNEIDKIFSDAKDKTLDTYQTDVWDGVFNQ